MILADSSIWIDYISGKQPELDRLLSEDRVLCHPYVIAELTLGSLGKRRAEILLFLRALPSLYSASYTEVMALIEAHEIYSRGIGYVDANLIASLRLRPGSYLLSKDKRLNSVAEEFGVARLLDDV